jgi:hypothetical protein
MRLRRTARGVPLLVALLAVLAACEPSFGIVVENRADRVLYAIRIGEIRGAERFHDVVVLAPDKRTTVGSNGAASHRLLIELDILDSGCQFVGRIAVDERYVEGGTITINNDGSLSQNPGGNPGLGVEPSAAPVCTP